VQAANWLFDLLNPSRARGADWIVGAPPAWDGNVFGRTNAELWQTAGDAAEIGKMLRRRTRGELSDWLRKRLVDQIGFIHDDIVAQAVKEAQEQARELREKERDLQL
jgi:hypothetical protein